MKLISRGFLGALLWALFSVAGFSTKLVTYEFRGEARLGAWLDGQVVDLNRAYRALLEERGVPRAAARAGALVPAEMVEFLRGEEDSLQAAREALGYVQQALRTPQRAEPLRAAGVLFSGSEVKLKAPIPNPPHVLAIGLNYRAHAAEVGRELPEYPTVFSKHGAVIGPGETIVIPAVVQQPDYEAELAFVIGKRARHVSREKALDYVVGYTVFNDVSARDVQRQTTQWTLGKSPDTFTAMGPYLVLKDEVPDPHALRIRTRIGDEVLQDSHTGDMIFTVAQVIEYITQVLTLEPGTVVCTGTPSGVGSARNRFLQPGEVVTVEIEKLGELSNPVARESHPSR